MLHTAAAMFATVVLYPEVVVGRGTSGGRVILAVGDLVFTSRGRGRDSWDIERNVSSYVATLYL